MRSGLRNERRGKMRIASFGSGVKLALATTVEHKMRSFLTVLGVIIGTGAVIGVGSIIAGWMAPSPDCCEASDRTP